MLRRVPSSIRSCSSVKVFDFFLFSFPSFHSFSSFSSSFSSFLKFHRESLPSSYPRRPVTPTAPSSPQAYFFNKKREELYQYPSFKISETLEIIFRNEMALRAVRNRQAAAASAPYLRPTTISIPSVVSNKTGAPKGLVSSSSQSNKYSTDAAASFPLQKKYGQHLLKNPGILDKLLLAANINSSDVVLEIGPGTGNLTVRLCPLARQVRAMDVDSRMIAEVDRRCKSLGFYNLQLIHGDALREDLGKFDVCAANLPYQISSPFLFKLIAHKQPFRCAVLMFQEEFGERLLASPGDSRYCRLSVNVQLFAKVSRVCKVDRNSFKPPPKVDSVIVKIVPKHDILPVDFREWNGLLRICFNRKRRTLLSIFKTPSVLSYLESNHKIASSIKNKTYYSGSKFKEYCLEAVYTAELHDKRSVSITTQQFYNLLLLFHKKLIFFQNAAEVLQSNQQNLFEDQQHIQGVDEMIFMEDDEEMSADSEDEDTPEKPKKKNK